MDCEHFIYALFDEGYRLLKTSGVNKKLSDETFKTMMHVGDNITDEAYLVHYWPQEKLLTYSHIKPAQDKHGRTGVSNHTILLDITDLIQPLTSQFFERFSFSDSLEPIKLQVKVTE